MSSIPKDDTIRNLKNVGQNFQNAASDSREDLQKAANSAGKTVRQFIHDAGDEIAQYKDTVTTQIRTNPVQSSMIALGVGFVLGALFRR